MLAIAACIGCRGDARPAVGDTAPDRGLTARATPADSARLSAAQQALRAFLDASRESTPDPVALDTLAACGEGGQSYFPTTLLAGYTLLAFESRGDTIIGRAEVISVAEQDIDRRVPDRFVARQRIRSDVLEWDVIPDGDGRWSVCNGLRFGYHGADSLTTWRPEGASYETARRLADSIAAVRR
jgi:hypothetical protein